MATTLGSSSEALELKNRKRRRLIVRRVLTYALLVFIALLVILPLLWMLSTSLKPKSQWFSQQIYWIPKTITLDNYAKLLSNPSTPIVRWFFNSMLIATVTTALVLAVDSLAAYAYARMEFRGRRVLFAILLATLFMPGIMFLIPNFLTVYRLGLLNHYGGVILPGLAGVFGVFFSAPVFREHPRRARGGRRNRRRVEVPNLL